VQKRGGKEGYDAQGKNKVAVPPLSDEFPNLESMTIRMVYYQKGDNPVLMTRTLHVYPESDPAFMFIPCLIHDCEGGSFELAPIVYELLRKGEGSVSGQLSCVGSANRDIPPDHAGIEYAIEAVYRSATKPEPPVETKPAGRKKVATAAKEAIPAAEPARKPVVHEPAVITKPVETARKSAAKAAKPPVEPIKKPIEPIKPITASSRKPSVVVSMPTKAAKAMPVPPQKPASPDKTVKRVALPPVSAKPIQAGKKQSKASVPIPVMATNNASTGKSAKKAMSAGAKPPVTKTAAAKPAVIKPVITGAQYGTNKAAGASKAAAAKKAPLKTTSQATSKSAANTKAVPAAAKPVPVKPVSVKPVSVKPVSVKPVSVKPVPVKPVPVKPAPVKNVQAVVPGKADSGKTPGKNKTK